MGSVRSLAQGVSSSTPVSKPESDSACFVALNVVDYAALASLDVPCVLLNGDGDKFADECKGNDLYFLPTLACTADLKKLHAAKNLLQGKYKTAQLVSHFTYGNTLHNTLSSYLKAIGDDDGSAQMYLNSILLGDTAAHSLVDLEAPIDKESPLYCLTTALMSEDDLRDLEITPPKKFLGPIHEGVIGEIYGPRGIGKTWLRDALALGLTRGMDLGPFKSESPASVLVIDGEMPLYLLQDRYNELSRNIGPAKRPIKLITNEGMYKATGRTINLMDPDWRDSILELISLEKDQWDAIFLDNLSALLPGIKENDQDAWGPINQWLLKFRWMGKAPIFVHHAGKSGDQRGTSGREDQVDFVLKLTVPTGYNPEDGCKFDATLTKSRSLFGTEAQPFTFSIIPHQDGGLTWATTGQKESTKQTIVSLLGKGLSQSEVAKMVNRDKSAVTRARQWGIDKGLINENNSFTDKGKALYADF